jgi:hypothetical protein
MVEHLVLLALEDARCSAALTASSRSLMRFSSSDTRSSADGGFVSPWAAMASRNDFTDGNPMSASADASPLTSRLTKPANWPLCSLSVAFSVVSAFARASARRAAAIVRLACAHMSFAYFSTAA